MLRTTVFLALLGLCSFAAADDSTQTYASLQPYTYTVDLSYVLNGVAADPAPCTNPNSATSDCLPQVSVTDKDQVVVSYSGPATAGNTVSIMWCFSNYSSTDRPWRKPKAIISEDSQCNVKKPVASGLPTGQGSYTWTPGPNTAPSTYFFQVLEVVAGSDPTTYAAAGRSTGFFQIIPIDDRPGWMLALVGVFCAVGPVTLAGFFYVEKVMKKRA